MDNISPSYKKAEGTPNRLIDEKSPYLLQHAYNPVDWYPWGNEAFEKAQKEKKPIFLSIGYSTCHWCHVMARECFEDEEVAKAMNQLFVSIKVDREERPDIDDIYMLVCQSITGSGGWPLSIILTPDKKPFFAATYIPKMSQGNFIGMIELIDQIQELWNTKHHEVERSADKFLIALSQMTARPNATVEPAEDLVKKTYKELVSQYDSHNGGFGDAPKFPSPHMLLFLLRYYHLTNDAKPLAMTEKTLTALREGGIYDQLGFGFHRYSTDDKWRFPHFEKMLYDQAMLLIAYTEGYLVSGNPLYARTAHEIISFVIKDLTAPEGVFYCALDAESEGQEGKYYLWSQDEIYGILGDVDGDIASRIYSITEEGNFTPEANQKNYSQNVLYLTKSESDISKSFNIRESQLPERLESIRTRLLAARAKRPSLHKDDKILTDWNALMICGLAIASRSLNNPDYALLAEKAMNFILTKMKKPEGGLLHRYRENEASIEAFADDYAFCVWALLELYQTTNKVKYLKEAIDLDNYFISHFWDSTEGGFFSTSDVSETILLRRKETYDGSYPSDNSIALRNQLILGEITGNEQYANRAHAMLTTFASDLSRSPSVFTCFVMSFSYWLGYSKHVVVVGNKNDERTKQILAELSTRYLPETICILKPIESEEEHLLNDLIPSINIYSQINNAPTLYVCSRSSCKPPTNDIYTALEHLR